MAYADYAYQIEEDDYTLDLPKKRFSILGFLSKLRNICILFLVVFVAYTAWPALHYDSYFRFRLILKQVFSKEAFAIIINGLKEGFRIHPIARSIELIVLAVAIWKLVFRAKIRAFLRVKSIVMLTLASIWIYLIIFEASG